MYYSKRYVDTENNSIMDLPLEIFLNIYGDEANTGECSHLCDTCKGCYDCVCADMWEKDGYGNTFVVACDNFKRG